MARQSISFSEPNHEWIAKKIASREFKSNSEVVNDALRKVREMENGIEAIRSALIEGEESGLSTRTPNDIINAVLEKRRLDGSL